VRFTSTYVATLSNGATGNDATLGQTFQISNPNPTPLNISFFEAVLFTPNQHQTGLFGSGNANSMTVTDGVADITLSGNGATAYQVASDLPSGNALFSLLYGGQSADLNNTGLPFSNNSGAVPFGVLEWSITVPGNGSVTIDSALTTSRAVPEPGSCLLIGGPAVILVLQRKRRQQSARSRNSAQRG
jgi:hypothetical protein